MGQKNEVIVDKLLLVIKDLESGKDLDSVPVYELFSSIETNEDKIIPIIISSLEKGNLDPRVFVIMNRYLNSMDTALSKILHFKTMIYEIYLVFSQKD